MAEVIGIASDHGGKNLKRKVREFLLAKGYEVKDYGVAEDSDLSVDYPDYASSLAEDISKKKLPLGILICGTGIGMSISANKVPNVRAALVWDEFTAQMSKEHNNAQILCLGERVLDHEKALKYVEIWLKTEFGGERHQKRLDKICQIELKHLQEVK